MSGELIAQVYLGGVAIAFVIGLFTMERIDGRTCTGEPEVLGVFIVACMWPGLLLVLALCAWVALRERGEP